MFENDCINVFNKWPYLLSKGSKGDYFFVLHDSIDDILLPEQNRNIVELLKIQLQAVSVYNANWSVQEGDAIISMSSMQNPILQVTWYSWFLKQLQMSKS